MKILEALRNRRSGESDAGTEAVASSPGEHELPIPGYDELRDKQITLQLSQLSQVELAAIESYERAHANRPAVLDKLGYMRGSEPLPDYDTLTPEQISTALDGTDSRTVKAVRDYERKFRNRQQVMKETARVLPTTRASAGEDRAHAEKQARVREGIAGRQRPPGSG